MITARRAALFAAALTASLAAFAHAQESRAPRGAEFDTDAVKDLAAKAAKLTLDERIGLVRRVQQTIAEELLTPSEAAWREWSDLRDRTDAGLTRLLQRGLFDESLVPPRGAGCYWSFTRRSHSYNEHPQIELQQWKFSSGFYGGAGGIVEKLDAASLRDVSEASVPAHFTASVEDLRKERRGAARPDAVIRAVYAVRTWSEDEFDVLAAFQVVERDDTGVTIAWRVIRQYDTPRRPPRTK